MYGKIIGLGPVLKGDKSKRTGKPFHGQSVYLTYKRREVDGLVAKDQYLDMLGVEKPPVLKVGQDIFLDFDDKGFLLDIEVVAPEK